jgi:hypothetical protein
MFYVRINKIRVFNNREGFLGLFNRSAEMRIYSYVAASHGTVPSGVASTGGISAADLMSLTADRRREKLLEAVLDEAGRFAQSAHLEIDGVKDNQSLTFGEAGMIVYQGDAIPATLDMQLWVIESDEDVRTFAIEADRVVDSDAFKGLLGRRPLLCGNPPVSLARRAVDTGGGRTAQSVGSHLPQCDSEFFCNIQT